MEWPSCDMELDSSTENGTNPLAKSVTKIMCGPDSGMIPIKTASSIMNGILSLVHDAISKY